MTAPELKLCPFCGGEAVFEHPIIEAAVWCRSCNAKIVRSANPLTHSYESGRKVEAAGVVSAWNTRADLTIRSDDPVLKQVMEALTRIGGYCREEICISQGEINCGRWARTALAALKERIEETK